LRGRCAVGPDYQRPEALFFRHFKSLAGWTAARPPGRSAARPVGGRSFEDAELDALLQKVDVSNQNVRAAEARLRQARALYDQARAGLYPAVNANASGVAARRRRSPTIRPSPDGAVNTFNANLGATWELDLWGKVRRSSRRATRPSRRAPPSRGGEAFGARRARAGVLLAARHGREAGGSSQNTWFALPAKTTS
jgi:outer membrane protein TolC